jgi:two-component system osmolarity sensor histidine kinase EnvZ
MSADLKRLDDERALLLAGVSHDLRTPLSRIRLGLEMMDEKGAGLKAGMVQDVEDIDAAINQFLDFARITEGEAVVPEGDLNALAREVCDRYSRSGKPLTARFAPRLPPIALRPLAIQRLVANLVDNALRHGGGTVELETGIDSSRATIEVLDRGPGIPPEEAERMLRPFTRLDTARSSAGSGLGLAIVDRIARLHGGSVQLLPRPGGGLRARVELPLKI